MILKELIKIFENNFPVENKESWDNVGLMVGDEEADIKKAYVCLDVTEETVNFTVENNCKLIVTHHPFIMPSLSNINFKNQKARMIRELIKNDINVYSMHTNFDSSIGGINDILAKKLDLCDYEATLPQLYRKGILKNEISLSEFINNVKEILNVKNVICCGDLNKKVKTVGICSGGGGSLISDAYPCDVFLTGEAKYHEFQNALAMDIAVVAAGHFETENIALYKIREILKNNNIEVVEKEVFKGFSKIV